MIGQSDDKRKLSFAAIDGERRLRNEHQTVVISPISIWKIWRIDYTFCWDARQTMRRRSALVHRVDRQWLREKIGLSSGFAHDWYVNWPMNRRMPARKNRLKSELDFGERAKKLIDFVSETISIEWRGRKIEMFIDELSVSRNVNGGPGKRCAIVDHSNGPRWWPSVMLVMRLWTAFFFRLELFDVSSFRWSSALKMATVRNNHSTQITIGGQINKQKLENWKSF